MPQLRTVVVGAGISGLTLAWALRARGTPVTLLETSERVGGQIRSWVEDGFVLEAGPNGFLDRDGTVARVAEALGIGDRLRPAAAAADRRAIFVRGKVRSLPSRPPELLTSDILPWWAKLRLLLEPLSRRGPSGVDESLAHFGRRHLGRHVTETLLDAVQTGIFAGDSERLSVRAAFPRLHEMERSHRSLLLAAKAMRGSGPAAAPPRLRSFEGGLETLPRALGQELGDTVRLGVQVHTLEPSSGGWQVRWNGGGERFERVILAVPAAHRGRAAPAAGCERRHRAGSGPDRAHLGGPRWLAPGARSRTAGLRGAGPRTRATAHPGGHLRLLGVPVPCARGRNAVHGAGRRSARRTVGSAPGCGAGDGGPRGARDDARHPATSGPGAHRALAAGDPSVRGGPPRANRRHRDRAAAPSRAAARGERLPGTGNRRLRARVARVGGQHCALNRGLTSGGCRTADEASEDSSSKVARRKPPSSLRRKGVARKGVRRLVMGLVIGHLVIGRCQPGAFTWLVAASSFGLTPAAATAEEV